MKIETLELDDGTIGFRFTVKNSKNKVLKSVLGIILYTCKKPLAKPEGYLMVLLLRDISLTSSKGARW